MQIAYIVIIVFGFLEIASRKQQSDPIDQQKAVTKGGTLFWIGLLFFILSTLIKVFG